MSLEISLYPITSIETSFIISWGMVDILYKYIRGDIKFNSIDELIIQMGKDKEDVSAYLKQVDDYKVNLG